MKLEENELMSSTWIKLEEHMKNRLSVLRGQNDGDLNEMQTARLRGRIAELKSLLGLSEDPAIVQDE